MNWIIFYCIVVYDTYYTVLYFIALHCYICLVSNFIWIFLLGIFFNVPIIPYLFLYNYCGSNRFLVFFLTYIFSYLPFPIFLFFCFYFLLFIFLHFIFFIFYFNFSTFHYLQLGICFCLLVEMDPLSCSTCLKDFL